MTGDFVTGGHLKQLRDDVITGIETFRASRMESASPRRVDQSRNDSWNDQEGVPILIDGGDGLEKTFCIGVVRRCEKVFHRGGLDNLSRIHNTHPIAKLRNHPKVMRDEENGHADPSNEVIKDG